jgi:hypothetical protein
MVVQLLPRLRWLDGRLVTQFSVVCRKSKSHYDRQSVDQSVLVSGTHLGPSTNFSHFLFNYF